MYNEFIINSLKIAGLGITALVSIGIIGGTILSIIDYVKDKRNESR